MELTQKKARYVELLVFVVTLLHETYQQYPTEYCDLGPRNCTVFLCQYYTNDKSTCMFAPYQKTVPVFKGVGGKWSDAKINRLNTSESGCIGEMCCMTTILGVNEGGPGKVKMQFTNQTPTISQKVKIFIQHYEACVPASHDPYPAATYLNNNPTQCLNLSHYCNTTSTTTAVTTSMATTTQLTTDLTTTMPLSTSDSTAFITSMHPATGEPELQGYIQSELIEIELSGNQGEGKLSEISFNVETTDPNIGSEVMNASLRANSSIVKIIAAQLQANGDLSQYTKGTPNGHYTNKLQPIPGTPTLNLTVTSENNTSRLQAKISFVISLEDVDTSAYVLSIISSNSIGYAITWLKQVNEACGFFDTTKQQFSTDGCSTTSTTTTSITCFCNHTTVFAVLLSVQSYEIPSPVVLLSYITESISILCLIITIAILTALRKKVRSDRTVVQINLSVALLCFHSFNLFHELAVKENRACEVFTMATHFFLLATGTWMLLEGLTVFVMTTKQILSIDKKHPRKMVILKLMFGWGIPLGYVAGTAAIALPTHRYIDTNPPTYNHYYKCWVGTQYGTHQAAVVIPMAVIYVINVIIAVRVAWFIHKLRAGPANTGGAERNGADDIAASFKVFIRLCPVLGIGMVFGILTNVEPYEASVVFMYINVILNGLQGLFLLLVYCVFGTEVREAAVRMFQRVQLRFGSGESKSTQQSKNTNSSSRPGRSTSSTPAASVNESRSWPPKQAGENKHQARSKEIPKAAVQFQSAKKSVQTQLMRSAEQPSEVSLKLNKIGAVSQSRPVGAVVKPQQPPLGVHTKAPKPNVHF